MTDKERLLMAIRDLEKKIKYVDIVLNDKDYLETAVSEATRRMRERKRRYPEMLQELKSMLNKL